MRQMHKKCVFFIKTGHETGHAELRDFSQNTAFILVQVYELKKLSQKGLTYLLKYVII
jgi:hypothetical protein